MSVPAPSYNDANFRAQFPAFADTNKYPSGALSGYWTTGTAYINQNGGPGWCSLPQLQRALDLMCAHLAQIATQLANGQPIGVMTAATEGSVSITLQPPPTKTAFGYWLATTPYGIELRGLLGIVAGVGFYVGGSLERMGFRKIGGCF